MSKHHFIRNGSTFQVAAKADLDIHEKLPVGTYTVKFNEMKSYFYLETIENFELTGKIYGDTLRNADRVMSTFEKRDASTGILLNGEKGSGKTLLAKRLSIQAREKGISTIVINNPWRGELFNTFIQSIEEPTVIIFDEFEKVYDRDEQEQMLTLLDGVYPSKKLFILTCNDKYRVNDLMLNRPGRIFYRIEYHGLSSEFVREYAEDKLTDKSQIEPLVRVGLLFTHFNFDMLKAIVEEMNRYGESVQDAMRILNARPENNEETEFDYVLTLADGSSDLYNGTTGVLEVNPFDRDGFGFSIAPKEGDRFEKSNGTRYFHFLPEHIVHIDENTGAIGFRSKEGDVLSLTKKKPVRPAYHHFMV